ncbi:hypothetical protein ABPG74_005768 [Tetrahymena malaccensis]
MSQDNTKFRLDWCKNMLKASKRNISNTIYTDESWIHYSYVHKQYYWVKDGEEINYDDSQKLQKWMKKIMIWTAIHKDLGEEKTLQYISIFQIHSHQKLPKIQNYTLNEQYLRCKSLGKQVQSFTQLKYSKVKLKREQINSPNGDQSFFDQDNYTEKQQPSVNILKSSYTIAVLTKNCNSNFEITIAIYVNFFCKVYNKLCEIGLIQPEKFSLNREGYKCIIECLKKEVSFLRYPFFSQLALQIRPEELNWIQLGRIFCCEDTRYIIKVLFFDQLATMTNLISLLQFFSGKITSEALLSISHQQNGLDGVLKIGGQSSSENIC